MLLGRSRETEAIDALLEGARALSGGSLVLRGDPGVGKTALLEYALEQASDMKTVSVVGVPSESELPFAGVERLIRPFLGRLSDIPDLQSRALMGALGIEDVVAPDRYVVALGVLNILSAVADERPVLCVLDDAQWLDRDTLEAMAFVRRRLATEPIALVFSETIGTGTNTLEIDPPWLEIFGLDRVSSDSLLEGIAEGEIAPQVRAALWDASQGNPLALQEFLEALSSEERSGVAKLPANFRITTSLQQALTVRVQDLPATTRTLLLISAADATGDLSRVLTASRHLDIPEDALEPAETAGVIKVHEGVYTFRHPLMRTAVYQDAPFRLRQAVHRALADAYTPGSDQRAWHLAEATVGPDETLADLLIDTAKRAQERGAHSSASLALQRAARHIPDEARVAELLTEAAQSAWMAGDVHTTPSLLKQAIEAGPAPSVSAQIGYLKGEAECAWGDRRLGLALLLQAADNLAELDHQRAARMLIDAGRVAWQDADLESAIEIGQRLAALHLAEGAPEARSTQVMRGIGLVAEFRHEEAFSLLSVEDDGYADSQELHMLAWGALVRGDDVAARRLLLRASDTARSQGAVYRVPQILTNLTSLDAFSGHLQSARVHAAEGIALARDTGQEHVEAQLQAVLAWIEAVRGRDAHPHTVVAQTLAQKHHVQMPVAIVAWALALHNMGEGAWPGAFARLEAVATPGSDTFHPMIAFLSAADFVEVALRVDNLTALTDNLAKFAAFSSRSSSPWVQALSARVRALMASDEEKAGLFEEALAAHAMSSRTWDEARTRLLFGEHLRRTGQRSSSRQHLHYASNVFESLGATPWTNRAAAELRASGESLRSRRTSSPDDNLTPQQTEIVRLVRQGCTNKQIASQLFLSPRTVDYHLRNVFVKLGIASRSELVQGLP